MFLSEKIANTAAGHRAGIGLASDRAGSLGAATSLGSSWEITADPDFGRQGAAPLSSRVRPYDEHRGTTVVRIGLGPWPLDPAKQDRVRLLGELQIWSAHDSC